MRRQVFSLLSAGFLLTLLFLLATQQQEETVGGEKEGAHDEMWELEAACRELVKMVNISKTALPPSQAASVTFCQGWQQ